MIEPSTIGDLNLDGDEEPYILRLFVTGASSNSIRAITNIKQICDTYLADRYSLEIVDVHQQKQIAEQEQIIALPMLIKYSPLPRRRLIGDMSDTQHVLTGLGL
ncbi:circadian clock KaiB family protein [Spirosoma validum]|uniref:Circadian clock KaiB family protein n=1 Tax=Spirosoma validum TaxID=2771355 RepID=A0A927B5J9_9BACT|nr:circadian clock KaiB family protein [Spirosoma validum]MBD2755642.1 circadian clock KaiB family protein [Spirosoma validum]